MPSPVPPSLALLLDASRARHALKADVAAFASHRVATRVQVVGYAPRTKVLRVLCQLLAAHPELEIDEVRLRGVSGCSDFRGEIMATVYHDGEARELAWDFVWDCRWRARQAGYLDLLGYPDQSRAAREFDWQCFAEWAPRDAPADV